MRDEKGLINDEIYPPRATSAQKSGGRPVGDSGKSYAPDRKPTLQKRIKGKAVTEEETEITLSVSGKELQEHGIKNGEQVINYLKEKIGKQVDEIHREI